MEPGVSEPLGVKIGYVRLNESSRDLVLSCDSLRLQVALPLILLLRQWRRRRRLPPHCHPAKAEAAAVLRRRPTFCRVCHVHLRPSDFESVHGENRISASNTCWRTRTSSLFASSAPFRCGLVVQALFRVQCGCEVDHNLICGCRIGQRSRSFAQRLGERQESSGSLMVSHRGQQLHQHKNRLRKTWISRVVLPAFLFKFALEAGRTCGRRIGQRSRSFIERPGERPESSGSLMVHHRSQAAPTLR